MILDMNNEDWKKVEDSLAEALAPVFKEIFKTTKTKPEVKVKVESEEPEVDLEPSLEDRLSALEEAVYSNYEEESSDLEDVLLDKQSELLERLEKIEAVLKAEEHPIMRHDIIDLYKEAAELTIKINFIDEILAEQITQ